ncbi:MULTISPECIES: SDR family NAD(P)-dependent oxidoreductase [Streptomyces]|jgi:short-subunit dehydrogenase|uniref:SDR family NAD(P)-dependent oxidoreductase n=1 Tax=Streptomyces TaxID=1883 RepID=UPI001F166AAF|nr:MULTISPECIES: SDR family NAD(P)-dependent oxidoreductase [Streptomyces]MCF0087689.1 Serine 3-dehydrogenase [Streptomyces sp. MH192]MCF0099895.1 Serine 3-dehydrogenase [Streptomyces sp. MH191]WTI25269.1 SDR family NAD(P)-dependent oxidoreductase [Streptomyces jietaisiensis]
MDGRGNGRTSGQEGRGTALVTGASSGIGAAYAERLAADGWDTVLVARRADRLEDLAARLRAETGTEAEPLVADLASPDGLARVTARVARGDVGFLLNNAGINGYGPFAELEPALMAKVLHVNVLAVTALTRAAVPVMLEHGRGTVVNVASQLAFAGALPPRPLPERAVYGGSKGYVVTFTRTLAAELGGTPLRVQVLCPGLTATEFHLSRGEAPVPGREQAVHEEGGMPVGEVIDASLRDLEKGTVVCVPGVEGASPVVTLEAAELAIRSASRGTLA